MGDSGAVVIPPIPERRLRSARSAGFPRYGAGWAILFDDTNRKPVVRLHGKTKFVTVFDGDKDGIRHDVQSVEDLFTLREPIRAIVQSYM